MSRCQGQCTSRLNYKLQISKSLARYYSIALYLIICVLHAAKHQPAAVYQKSDEVEIFFDLKFEFWNNDQRLSLSDSGKSCQRPLIHCFLKILITFSSFIIVHFCSSCTEYNRIFVFSGIHPFHWMQISITFYLKFMFFFVMLRICWLDFTNITISKSYVSCVAVKIHVSIQTITNFNQLIINV